MKNNTFKSLVIFCSAVLLSALLFSMVSCTKKKPPEPVVQKPSVSAEDEARKRTEEEARLKAEDEARAKAKEEAKRRADEEARLKAEEEVRLKAEEEARAKAKRRAEFEKIAKERGFYSKELMEKIAKTGKASDADIPEDVKRLFVTALEISPVWHVKMQAVFQKHVDNAVSKTVNLPESASIADVKKVYLLAYELKCKGITIYRYGSKPGQVLYIGENVKAHAEYSGGCATGECSF